MAIPTDTPTRSTEDLLHLRDTLTPNDARRGALRAEAIKQNLALSVRLARRYAGRGEDLDDLRQVAAYALIKAVDGYDPGRGVPFAAYVCPYILGALKRHFRDTGWAMRVPRDMQELNHRVTIAVSDLGHQRARTPSQREIAEHLDVTVAEVRHAASAGQVYRLPSLDTPWRDSESADLVDLVGGPDVRFGRVDDRMTLRPLLARLAPREQRILTLRYGSQMTQSAIAADIGVSQMQVSRLLTRSLSTLRNALQEPGSPVRKLAVPTRTARGHRAASARTLAGAAV